MCLRTTHVNLGDDRTVEMRHVQGQAGLRSWQPCDHKHSHYLELIQLAWVFYGAVQECTADKWQYVCVCGKEGGDWLLVGWVRDAWQPWWHPWWQRQKSSKLTWALSPFNYKTNESRDSRNTRDVKKKVLQSSTSTRIRLFDKIDSTGLM